MTELPPLPTGTGRQAPELGTFLQDRPPTSGELSFEDVLDVINPLQHLPVIGDIYRYITGDAIKAPARLLGGSLFGGVVGLASSLVNVIVQEVSGRDIGGNVIAMLQPAEGSAPVTAALAERPAASPASSAGLATLPPSAIGAALQHPKSQIPGEVLQHLYQLHLSDPEAGGHSRKI